MEILAKNLIILASAGSGKTYQLGNRIAGLAAKGNKPERIVALTFTRKAAGEFADAVLMKLAEAASDGGAGKKLGNEVGLPGTNFGPVLAEVVRALPKLTFGTMDGFFAKVVRGFQYELGLTGGKFDLIEGPRAVAAKEEILSEILGVRLEEGTADELLHVFRRATYGKESSGVGRNFDSLVGGWHGRFREPRRREWGPDRLAGVTVETWEENKGGLVEKIRRGLDGLEYTDSRQRAALEKLLDQLENHTVAGGGLGDAGSMFGKICEAMLSGGSVLQVQHYKPLVIGGTSGDGFREIIRLAAGCEMAAAVARTRAVRDLVADYDKLCEERLRRRGLLQFDDVKVLMGRWVTGEKARLMREAVDFRLDARYDHWLLDEFQDTSGPDWAGLFPLIDEAATGDDRTMFIVGDRKQAIYGWRGGKVGLFDEVIDHYGIEPETISVSHRSCPEVLSLVNRVCGDRETMGMLFGAAADRWFWKDHVSAEKPARRENRGEARVEVVGKWEDRVSRTAEILHELGAGERAMTVGVLVRNNDKVRRIADVLRAEGFDVIEDGRREPAKDNPVGIALGELLKWLADPSDSFAWEVVAMSPFAGVLRERFSEMPGAIWDGLLREVSEKGFAAMVEGIVETCWEEWSAFGRRRAGDVIAALSSFDATGGVTPAEAADWVARLEVSQSPGIAAVQVMTIHKSKGLGFDAVILPEIPKDSVPAANDFKVAEGDGWICETPAAWARAFVPEMVEAEARWAADQRYEAMCILYVALTRAKRGLYVLLEPPAKSASEDRASLANWLATSVESSGTEGEVVFQEGSADWVENVPALEEEREVGEIPVLGTAVPRRARTTPSGEKSASTASLMSVGGMSFGSEVHAIFESVGWLDLEVPELPDSAAGGKVAGLLKLAAVRKLFSKGGNEVGLYREQKIEAVVDGKWLSGAVDRLHVHAGPDGKAERVEVIDFKTDAVKSKDELVGRYAGQMEAYRRVMAKAYPGAKVECLLVSTALEDVIGI